MTFTLSMLVQSAWTGPTVAACKLAHAGTPAQLCYAPLQFLFESGLIVLIAQAHFPPKKCNRHLKNVKDVIKEEKIKRKKFEDKVTK